ncbi:asparagine synthase, partial [Burkholderia sp. Ac-20379]|nr:asparagine synthase [Burkholderia sp. Ac-20379]
MIVGTRDPFGFQRLHYHPRSGASAGTIRATLQAAGHAAQHAPDAQAIAGYLSGARRF